VLSLAVKNFENRLIFREVIDMSWVSGFFDSQCIFVIHHFFLRLPRCFVAVSSRVGHGLDPSMDWIGLDWVR